ncbi:signal peptidase II [Mycolicibacterium arseniciresistens]|uniref:Lipoprotein signal peptidase n=1 Tax=Mycolicibacterium arseniciresistens TaxID=3062257 RepID=A0ABT8UC02_9MYCO|nr:signal peptidase II [Mycolicibacterium arseniciresistens]MDO3635318.1 signal peptidase II [Mycolicibacterium arseniciresistens]
MAAVAVIAAGLDLILKSWANRTLTDGSTREFGLLQLRLAFNPGVAFSLGNTVPPAVLLGVTSVIVIALAVFAFRFTRNAALPFVVALAALLGGAVANLIDRAADGVVSDYLHTGWFPTFNLADVFVVTGAAVLVMASLRTSETGNTGGAA